MVKVIHEQLGIVHGSMTTIHDITNTQSILDTPLKDLRRARACGMSLIPTTTGSATAITYFPGTERQVEWPCGTGSAGECIAHRLRFEVKRATTAEEVNQLLKMLPKTNCAAFSATKALVSIDYKTDPRSSIIDVLSTMVVNGTQVKLYAWYDNEWGYANRTAELTQSRICWINHNNAMDARMGSFATLSPTIAAIFAGDSRRLGLHAD